MNPEILKRLTQVTAEEQKILGGQRYIDRDLYMEDGRNVISAAKLLRPGELLAVRPNTRFIAFPEHTHDYVELVYMCQGETRHTVNGREVVLKEGDFLMLGQYTKHSVAAAGENDIAVNFIILPSFIASTLPYIGDENTPIRQFILGCLTNERNSDSLLFRVGDVLPVRNQVENIIFALLEKTPYKRNILRLSVGLLFALLLNYTDRLTMDTVQQNVIVSVLRYIEEHYQDGTLEEIAGALNYEATSLSRLIQNTLGENFTELIQKKRLEQAAWLLKNTDCKVEEIASAVGYENKSYFYRLFSARFHRTPKKYRDCI